jgi:hypothetical protein
MRRHPWLILASTAMLAFLAGCEGLPGASSGSSGTSNPCSTDEVRRTAERFIDAFNRGDLVRLDQLVYQPFSTYATTARESASMPRPTIGTT